MRNSVYVLLGSMLAMAITIPLMLVPFFEGKPAHAVVAWAHVVFMLGFFSSMVTVFGFLDDAVRKLWFPVLEKASDGGLVRMRDSKVLCGRDQEILNAWMDTNRPHLAYMKAGQQPAA